MFAILLAVFMLNIHYEAPIAPCEKRMTIITPSIRPWNLPFVKDSIDFDYVDEWIIVYDGSKIGENPHLFDHPKIKEYIHTSQGRSGNPQRNFALDHVQNENTYIYFLDDDNTIHPDLYRLLDVVGDGYLYTFDQKDRLLGNSIARYRIDTAMFLVDFKLCKGIKWRIFEYTADFDFVNACYSRNKDRWVYVNNVLCNYNTL